MSRLRATSRLLACCLAVGLAIAACGGDDDSSSNGGLGAGVASQATSGGDGAPATAPAPAADGGSGTSASPEIDAAAMPAPGGAQFVVEGSTYDFTSAGAAVHVCSVDPSMITVEYQAAPGTLAIQASSADGDRWQGVAGVDVTVKPDGTERIYVSTPGIDGTFAIEGAMVLYEGVFNSLTMADPGNRAAVGVGTVTVTC